jgi:streptomycin 6-kinase
MSAWPFEIPRFMIEANIRVHGDRGRRWAADLPGLLASLMFRWSLAPQAPFANLSYGYVLPVTCGDGTPAVLKLGLPDEEFRFQADALRAFDGRMSVRLLDADIEAGALLLERLQPGEVLASLGDDAGETSAAARVMRGLWRPAPPDLTFPSMGDWLDGMRNEAREEERVYPGDLAWLWRALDLAVDLLKESSTEVLLHGDLHHDNILSSSRETWLAIDPKGVTGDPAWEVAPFLYNNVASTAGETEWRRLARRRIDQFADELALDRHRLYACSAVRSSLSAGWSLGSGHKPTELVIRPDVICADELFGCP